MPETSYAPCGDLSLAYQVFGDGPVELVWAGSFTSHVELYWTMPEFGSLMEKLGTFARVLLFDKAGVGLSDPVPKVPTLDERAAEIEAVMDAAVLPDKPVDTPGRPPRRMKDRRHRRMHLCACRDDDPAYCWRCHVDGQDAAPARVPGRPARRRVVDEWAPNPLCPPYRRSRPWRHLS